MQIMEFYQECSLFTREMCKKIFEKSPLKHNFVRFVSCISPSTINNTPDAAKKRMEKLLLHLVSCRWISSSDGDVAESQFNVLCRHAGGTLKKMFEDWRENDRLDNFYSKILDSGFKKLDSVFKTVFVLSHGNASVESGFSINQEVIVENLTEQSLVNLRLVYDSIKRRGGTEKVEVDKAMIAEERKASNRYKMALSENKKQKEKEHGNALRKRKLESELRDVATKRKAIRNVATEEILSL